MGPSSSVVEQSTAQSLQASHVSHTAVDCQGSHRYSGLYLCSHSYEPSGHAAVGAAMHIHHGVRRARKFFAGKETQTMAKDSRAYDYDVRQIKSDSRATIVMNFLRCSHLSLLPWFLTLEVREGGKSKDSWARQCGRGRRDLLLVSRARHRSFQSLVARLNKNLAV